MVVKGARGLALEEAAKNGDQTLKCVHTCGSGVSWCLGVGCRGLTPSGGSEKASVEVPENRRVDWSQGLAEGEVAGQRAGGRRRSQCQSCQRGRAQGRGGRTAGLSHGV